MTCIVGRAFSWAHLERLRPHVHLVLEADVFGRNPPCGVALGADIEGRAETFLCLHHARDVGRAAEERR